MSKTTITPGEFTRYWMFKAILETDYMEQLKTAIYTEYIYGNITREQYNKTARRFRNWKKQAESPRGQKLIEKYNFLFEVKN